MHDCEDCGRTRCRDCDTHYCTEQCPCKHSHTCDCACDEYLDGLASADETSVSSHYGNDPMGAPTEHKGSLENCPAPECQDQAADRATEK